MAQRSIAIPLAVLFSFFPASLAGCLAPSGDVTGPAPILQPPAWTLDCSIGTPRADFLQSCLAQASFSPGSKTETWAAVNPRDPDNVVLGAKDLNPTKSQRCVWNDLMVTHDGGKTWKEVTVGGNYADRKPGELWFGYACNTDPMFAFSADGTLHFVLDLYGLGTAPRTFTAAGASMLLATSRDGGETWGDVINLITGDGETTSPDYPRITVSPKTGTILVSFIDFLLGGRCYIGSSRDQGRTADLPVIIPMPDRGLCAAIAAAPDGTITVLGAGALSELAGGRGTVWASFSTDDGKTFSGPSDVFPASGFGRPLEAVYDLTSGPRAGTLYVIHGDTEAGTSHLFVRRSLDHGRSWSEAFRITEPASEPQGLANLAVAGDGSLHAFYVDGRYDAAGKLVDLVHARSADGGETWTSGRVTSQGFDPSLGRHQDGGATIGDYLGVAASGNHVWLATPDSTNGQTTVIAAAHVRLQ